MRCQSQTEKNRPTVTADKASGLANEAIGKVKQGIGSVVRSDKLKEEGAAQELKGNAQRAVGDAKAAVKDWANKAAAAADDLESKIRERAHRIWQQEGSPEGRAHESLASGHGCPVHVVSQFSCN
jgi:uncharacterized protein YjbJ (UPF0337 family)